METATSMTANGANRTTTDSVSLFIIHMVLAATSEDFLRNLLIICCMTTLVTILIVMFGKMSSMRTALVKLARRVGLMERYQVYTISGHKLLKENDGTESTMGEFDYVSMTS